MKLKTYALGDAGYTPTLPAPLKLRSKRSGPHSNKRIHHGAATKTTPTTSRLTRRSCLSAALAGREASFTEQAAQHAFFASFLVRTRRMSPAGTKPGQRGVNIVTLGIFHRNPPLIPKSWRATYMVIIPKSHLARI